jgi:hypothetical protein
MRTVRHEAGLAALPVIFSLALNVGTIGTFAYLRLQDRRESAPRGELAPPPLPMRELWANLNLDESQRAALRRLWPDHWRRVRTFRGELARKRQELFILVKQEPAAWPPLQAKIREISDLQGRLEEEVLGFFLRFQQELRPEQNEAFLVLLERRLTPLLGGHRGPAGRQPVPGKGRGMGSDCPMPGGPPRPAPEPAGSPPPSTP